MCLNIFIIRRDDANILLEVRTSRLVTLQSLFFIGKVSSKYSGSYKYSGENN